MAKSFTEVEELKIINIDEIPVAVDELPDEIQERVELYNLWRQEHVDKKIDLLKVENALNSVSRDIVGLIRAERAKAEQEAAEGETTEATAEVEAEQEPQQAVN